MSLYTEEYGSRCLVTDTARHHRKRRRNMKIAQCTFCLFAVSIFIEILTGPAADAQTTENSVPLFPHREVVVAVPRHFPPQYDVDEEGRPQGFAIDVFSAIANNVSLSFRYEVASSWTGVLNELASAKADLIPNIGITPERATIFDFTQTIDSFAISFFIRASTAITTPPDLPGSKVASVTGNAAVDYLNQHKELQTTLYNDIETALFALLSGQVDSLLYPIPWTTKLARDAEILHHIKIAGDPVMEVKRAMAVRKGDIELLQRLNFGIDQLLSSGEYSQIYNKWYGLPKPFWTMARALWALGIVMALCLMGAVAGLVTWRYRSILSLNCELSGTLAAKARADEALAESEENFRALTENAADGIIVFSEKKIVFANSAAVTLLGYALAELYELNFEQTIQKSDRDIAWRHIVDGLTGRTAPEHRRLTCVTRHNVRFAADVTASTTLWRGRPAGLLILRDVSEQVAAQRELELHREHLEELVIERTQLLESSNRELSKLISQHHRTGEALRESESLLATAQELAQVGAWEWNTTNNTLRWSPVTYRIFGLNPKSFIAKYDVFLERIHRDDRLFVEQTLQASLSQQDHFDIRYRIVRPDGTERVVHARGKPERDANGQCIRIIGALHDVTESYEVDKIKKEFVSTVSHELRTPLTSIRGALGLLESMVGSGLPAQAQTLLSISTRNAERLANLVNDILDIEKIEAGKLCLVREPLLATELLHEAVESNQGYALKYGVTYNITRCDEKAVLFGDRARLLQVLSNLMSNAAKFSPEGSTVCLSAESIAGGGVRITVADSGCGISDKFRDSIFQKFSQHYVSNLRPRTGTGLGLCISKAIVDQHGGKIDFLSTLGVGTVFYVDLPSNTMAAAARIAHPSFFGEAERITSSGGG